MASRVRSRGDLRHLRFQARTTKSRAQRRGEIRQRVFLEPALARQGTEADRTARVPDRSASGGRVDVHQADWIESVQGIVPHVFLCWTQQPQCAAANALLALL